MKYTVLVANGKVSEISVDRLHDAQAIACGYILLYLSDPQYTFSDTEVNHIKWMIGLGLLVPTDLEDKKISCFADAIKEYMHARPNTGAPKIRITAKKVA